MYNLFFILISALVDCTDNHLPHSLRLLYIVHTMEGSPTPYKLYASCAQQSLEEGLVEVHCFYLEQRYLGHLYIQDAVFLHKPVTGNGKLAPCTHYPTYYIYNKGKYKKQCTYHIQLLP